MVRHATPLVVAPALPPVGNRIEMLIAEARLRHPATVGVEEAEEPLLTVLVSFDPTDADRRAARVLASSFMAAACSFERAPAEADIGTWLTETSRRLPASWVCIVIALPEYEAEVDQQLQSFLNTIRGTGHHYVPLVVGTATMPADWSGLGLDGFVITELHQRVAGALQVFSMLANVMAPGLMCCLDAHDFWSAFGAAASPSQIAQATYFPDSSSFVPASRIDRQVLAASAGIAVMPGRCLRLAAQSRLVAAVRASGQPDTALTIVVPWGLTVEPLGADRSVDVLLICRGPLPAD
jgi:hypothetical protein